MKAGFLILIIFCMLSDYVTSQSWQQYQIIDEFEADIPGFVDLGYDIDNESIWIYDSTEKVINKFSVCGTILDSFFFEYYEFNGIAVYSDTLFAMDSKIGVILKINPSNGEVYDSIFIEESINCCHFTDLIFLDVSDDYFVSFCFSGGYCGWHIIILDRDGNFIANMMVSSSAGIAFSNSGSKVFSLKFDSYVFEFITDDIINNPPMYDIIHTIPVSGTKGISFTAEDSFYTYSPEDKKVYKIGMVQTYAEQHLTKNSSFSIFPNPATDNAELLIEADLQLDDAEIIFYKINGKEISRQKICSYNTILKFDQSDKGIYIFKLFINSENKYSGKIIIE